MLMVKKPAIIVFIGNVGAGKTTHILATSRALERAGFKVRKTYIKTTFFLTKPPIIKLFGNIQFIQIFVWRLLVSLDLLLNSIYIPIITWIRTILIPAIMREHVVLVEEHIIGSLVDFVHAALLLNLEPIVIPLLKILTKLSRICSWSKIIYLFVIKKLLPKRWIKRGTLMESKLYLLVQDLLFMITFRNTNNDIMYVNNTKEISLSYVNDIIKILRKENN